MLGEEVFQTIPEWAWFSQGGRRKRQKQCNVLTRKFPWKSSPTTHLPFLLSNPKILKALPKTFPHKMKPTINAQQQKKKWGEKSKRRGEERKRSQTVTRTQLTYLQKALFGKISRSKWVNEDLMAIKKIIFQTNFFQQHHILLTGVVSWGPILARIPPSILSLSWRTLEFSYVKYFGIGISMSSYK